MLQLSREHQGNNQHVINRLLTIQVKEFVLTCIYAGNDSNDNFKAVEVTLETRALELSTQCLSISVNIFSFGIICRY
jgi:hypothetical protein